MSLLWALQQQGIGLDSTARASCRSAPHLLICTVPSELPRPPTWTHEPLNACTLFQTADKLTVEVFEREPGQSLADAVVAKIIDPANQVGGWVGVLGVGGCVREWVSDCGFIAPWYRGRLDNVFRGGSTLTGDECAPRLHPIAFAYAASMLRIQPTEGSKFKGRHTSIPVPRTPPHPTPPT